MSSRRWLNSEGLSIYVLAVACLLLGPWNDASLNLFALSRAELAAGEFWRFWTGPLVHASWAHILINVFGLIILQQVFGHELSPKNWSLAVILLAPAIGMLWLLSTELAWLPYDQFDYVVGLSALLHALFIYFACVAIDHDKPMAIAVLAIISLKVIWEQIAAPSGLTADLIGMPVAVNMHLFGLLGGAFLGIGYRALGFYRS